MKKEFKLTDSKRTPARQVDSVKHEINKYIARERRKPLVEGGDFWDFDCRFGKNKENAEIIHISDINKAIDREVGENAASFYIEILAKVAKRLPKLS